MKHQMSFKFIACLLILGICGLTVFPISESEAGCWSSLVNCLAAAANAFATCHKNPFSAACAIALAAAVAACYDAYEQCLGS